MTQTFLIADSGGTKTDWTLVNGSESVSRLHTDGLNPLHVSRDIMQQILQQQVRPLTPRVDAIWFYGSGCTPEQQPGMEALFRNVFPEARMIAVNGDLLAAARALCGDEAGVACILGTGANSCLYDGKSITANVPPLGYILGDEGSGAVLGKLFLNAIFKGDLPVEVRELYLQETRLTYADVIAKTYREPQPNRFLASISLFVGAHKDAFPALRQLVIDNFSAFLRKNVAKYGRPDLPISAIGSVAFHFQDELRLAAAQEGFTVGTIEKSPMEGLLRYHGRLQEGV